MEHIHKKILLEQFKTRFPIIYPALRDRSLSLVNDESMPHNQNANYDAIPYGVNESICGQYSNFTKEMGDKYAGKVLSYCMLERWYYFFVEYYQLLYKNKCKYPYSSATEYYISFPNADESDVEYDDYKQMDITFAEIGGSKFYNWLKENYFFVLDLKDEYFIAKKELESSNPIKKSYPQWVECIDNLSNHLFFYPDAYELYEKVAALYIKFGENPVPSKFEDCCSCVDYINMGGSDLYFVLKNWIKKEKVNIDKTNGLVEYHQEELEPSATIQIHLKRKVEDFGNLSIFCKDYVLGQKYNIGNVCYYNDNVYILKSGVGYISFDGTMKFDEKGWRKYSDYYRMNNQDEFTEYPKRYALSGRTVSSLDSFLRTVSTVDLTGNILPGYFEPQSGATFIQPAEDSLLDIIYEIGKTANVTKISDNEFNGDLLLYAEIYYLDEEDNKILSSVVRVEEGDDFLSKIDESNEAASQLDILTSNLCIDFVYYKKTNFTYKEGKAVPIRYTVDGADYEIGVKCIDHCKMEINHCSYHINSKDSYVLRYFNVIKDVEEKYSEESNDYVSIAMCDWYVEPSVYENNDMVIAPALRKEELLGFSVSESVTNNIYVDRGYSTVLDKHLRIGEVSSLDALSQYGNGSFNLINLEEEKV